MISGRCSFSSILRYASELSKKPRSHGRLFFPIDVPFSTINVRQYRSDVPGRFSFPTRMASTSTREPKTDGEASTKPKNRLAYEKSPYLLQHATNPVDWYPWGEEALEKAKKEDKLIFLSVGYSTCHWCHVMERESFENKEIARIMNHYFVNIKVDREERPDIDRIYMTFIQLKGTSGWPMSVFLTSDLKPLLGGTYFPPDDSNPYRPGFKTVLLHMAKEWNENRSKLLGHGNNILEVLKELFEKRQTTETQVPSLDCSRTCVQQLVSEYDPEFGGFRGSQEIHSPKFPQPVNFNFLFHMYARDPSLQECLDMCVNTLTKMAYGGIHDHVGQGFARYSVDGEWHVPHFEKMLYDQAQLLQSYADAFVATKNPFFSEIVDDIATYVIRDLRHKEGGFYSAEDADSLPEPNATAKREGAFYVWTHQDITRLLSKDIPEKSIKLSDLFCHHFNIKKDGNVRPWQDPHGELKMQNVLIAYDGIEKTAEHFHMAIDEVQKYIQEACRILFVERSKRPRPHLDDKIVTAWNGLMISGLSRAGVTTNNKQYIDYAIDAAKFLQKYLYDKSAGVLLRSCYRTDGDVITHTRVPIHGFHDDYAFTVKGLLDLYEATFDAHWLEFAEKLQTIQDDLFWDSENGGYFSTTTSDPSVLLRLKSGHDGAEPSGNSTACGNLLRLAVYLNSSELKDKAERILIYFRKTVKRTAIALPQMVSALLHYYDDMTQIYIAGKLGAKDTDKLLRVIHERLIPGKVLFFADHDESDNILFRKSDVIGKMKPLNGQATAYVCRHHECSLPVTSPNELASLLDERR